MHTPQTGWLAEQARKPAPVGHICLLTCRRRRRRCHPPLVVLRPQVWLPGDAMEDGETLQYDPTAYDCMSSMSLDWPSLSFDLLRDHLGAPRAAFPHTLFMVAGTQASSAKSNYLAVMKVSGLAAGKHVAARQKEQQQQREREQGGQQGGQQGQQRQHCRSANWGHLPRSACAGATRCLCCGAPRNDCGAVLPHHSGASGRPSCLLRWIHV